MTGFGRCEVSEGERKITVEMKSVNHRYLDVTLKMPKKLNFFESAIRAIEFDDTKEAKETLSYAADVYYTRKTIRKRHIQRMKDGECSPDVGVYFLDIISSMERIAGYAFTIARYILSQNDEEE